jgi:hypothetical protein
MLIVFFDIQGIVHKEFISPGQTVNGEFCWEVLKRLGEGIRRKCWQVEEKQLVSPPWQHACSHITHCSTIPDFQKHYSDSPLHLPYLAPATFSYSPRWNYGCKGIVLTRLRRSTQKHKRLSTHSHLRTSGDAWNHGKHAGIAVYVPKGTTSKERVETRSYGKKLFLWAISPNFWVVQRMDLTHQVHYLE